MIAAHLQESPERACTAAPRGAIVEIETINVSGRVTLTGVSRGPEAVEQTVLEHTRKGGIWPVIFLAKASGRDIGDPSVRQSFAGAARQLHMKGLVEVWWIVAPSARITLESPSNSGNVMCVSQPGVELTAQLLWQVRDMVEAVFDPTFDNLDLEILERSFQQIAYDLSKSTGSPGGG